MTPKQIANSLLERAVVQANASLLPTFCARLGSEKPPSNTRHLTDTRTRVSSLLETVVGIEMNRLAIADKREAGSVSAVLWNVFPDLRIRDSARNPLIGLEVKAVHTAAEEKSANLSTPLNSIRKGHDFLVILLWSWDRSVEGGFEYLYPKIHKSYLLDAYQLAKARDYNWLSNQASGRFKAIDLATALITPPGQDVNDLFQAEGGNLGKLMRISLDDAVAAEHGSEMQTVLSEFTAFQNEALLIGVTQTFKELCIEAGWRIGRIDVPSDYPSRAHVIGCAFSSDHGVFAVCGRLKEDDAIPDAKPGDTVVFFGKKLEWEVSRVGPDMKLVSLKKGKKAESNYGAITDALN